MSEELKPCPCGQNPACLCITPGDTCKWAWVSGSCCSDWHIEMRTDYLPLDDARLMVEAAECWNLASRPAPAVQVPSRERLEAIAADVLVDWRTMYSGTQDETLDCMEAACRYMLAAAPQPKKKE